MTNNDGNVITEQVHAFADKECTNTVLILVNTDATAKSMDSAGGGTHGGGLWYVHDATAVSRP